MISSDTVVPTSGAAVGIFASEKVRLVGRRDDIFVSFDVLLFCNSMKQYFSIYRYDKTLHE